MAVCKDQLTRALNEKGYSVVRYPKTDILPLMLVGVDGSSRQLLGSVKDLSGAPVELPKITHGQGATLTVSRTEKMKAGYLFSVTGECFSSLGVSLPKLKHAYKSASVMSLALESPTTQTASVIALGPFLKRLDLDFSDAILKRYLFSGAARLYLITEVFQTATVSIEAFDEQGAELDVNLLSVEDAVSGEFQVAASGSSSRAITYQGKTPVTVGFKALELYMDRGHLSVRGAPPDFYLGGGTEPEAPEPLDAEGLTDFGS